MSANTCCTELGTPPTDLSLNALCAKKAVICNLTAKKSQIENLNTGRLTAAVLDITGGPDLVSEITDLTIVSSLTVGSSVLTGCATSPLAISGTNGFSWTHYYKENFKTLYNKIGIVDLNKTYESLLLGFGYSFRAHWQTGLFYRTNLNGYKYRELRIMISVLAY